MKMLVLVLVVCLLAVTPADSWLLDSVFNAAASVVGGALNIVGNVVSTGINVVGAVLGGVVGVAANLIGTAVAVVANLLPIKFGNWQSRGGKSFNNLPTYNGWIVLTQRFRQGPLDFNKGWNDYKNGFGDFQKGEFWLGNELVYLLTNSQPFRLRVELKIGSDWYFADYDSFKIDSEGNGYKLYVSGYRSSSSAPDALSNVHSGFAFATNDRDYYNCASRAGGGFWYVSNYCYNASPTGDKGYSFVWNNAPLEVVRFLIAPA